MSAQQKAARRAQILQGARHAIAQHGYERATIQKIARAAEITPGLIHYHFANKLSILTALIEELAERQQARFDLALQNAQGGDPVDAFLDAQLGLSQGVDLDALISWVAISAEAVHHDEVRLVFGQAMARQHALLKGLLVTHRRCPEAQADEVASAALSMIQGVFLLSRASPQLLPEGFAVRQLRASLQGMLIFASARA